MDYPLKSKCLTLSVVDEMEVRNNMGNENKIYYGLAETSFKERHKYHKNHFNSRSYINNTELVKYMWH